MMRKGICFSEEHKRRMSEAHLGKHWPPDIKQRMSESHKGQIPWNRGLKGMYHLSEETKQKLSEAFRGEKHPMFGRRGEKNPAFGKNLSKDHRQKISEALRGRHLSEEHKWKLSEANRGEKSSSWNGGSSFLPYPLVFNGSLKRLIKKRDRDQCQNPDCEQKPCYLVVHHIDYNKENCHPLNLITLCVSCNSKANNYRKEWEKLYMEIIQHGSSEHFTRTN